MLQGPPAVQGTHFAVKPPQEQTPRCCTVPCRRSRACRSCPFSPVPAAGPPLGRCYRRSGLATLTCRAAAAACCSASAGAAGWSGSASAAAGCAAARLPLPPGALACAWWQLLLTLTAAAATCSVHGPPYCAEQQRGFHCKSAVGVHGGVMPPLGCHGSLAAQRRGGCRGHAARRRRPGSTAQAAWPPQRAAGSGSRADPAINACAPTCGLMPLCRVRARRFAVLACA
jgi:hypothetical protein